MEAARQVEVKFATEQHFVPERREVQNHPSLDLKQSSHGACIPAACSLNDPAV